MQTIHSYLSFNGNCREAMEFYQQCLGGELTFQVVGESLLAKEMPERMRKCILHAELRYKQMVLLGTDLVPEDGLLKGNRVSVMLNCNSEEEIKRVYARLSHDGEQSQPLQRTFWGAILGSLADKYGNRWILNCNRNQSGVVNHHHQ